jgi:hypothetical protein
MNKKNILLVGCGNIGFRHIELLIHEKNIEYIYIFDKNLSNSVKLLKKSKLRKKIFILKKLNFKIKNIFLCIIATHSLKRLELIYKIIKLHNPKYILSEKIIENDIFEIKKYNKFLLKKKIFINCPSRLRKIFSKLINIYNKEKIEMTINGGNWNLLSNCIHFIDLVSFITGENMCKLEISENSYLINSKHKNFKELIGNITINFNRGSVLKLCSYNNSDEKIIKVSSQNKSKLLINFNKNKINYRKNIFFFKEQFQSLLTIKIFKDLVKNKKINLPCFKKNISDTIFLLKELKKNRLFKYKKK